jgi:hypothetical protein
MKMKPQLILEPLKQWTTEVIRLGKEKGHSNKEIATWIRTYSQKQGWKKPQIYTVLKNQGITEKLNPLRVICPKCDDVGRLSGFYNPRIGGGNHYVIVHGPIKGKWGKTKPGKRRNIWGKGRGVRKKRRCYFYNLFEHPEYLRRICDQLFPQLDD